MRLIPERRKSWRMLSMQAMGLALAIEGAWLALPAEMKSSIPDTWISCITIVLMILGIIGRLVVQPKVTGDADA